MGWWEYICPVTLFVYGQWNLRHTANCRLASTIYFHSLRTKFCCLFVILSVSLVFFSSSSTKFFPSSILKKWILYIWVDSIVKASVHHFASNIATALAMILTIPHLGLSFQIMLNLVALQSMRRPILHGQVLYLYVCINSIYMCVCIYTQITGPKIKRVNFTMLCDSLMRPLFERPICNKNGRF